MNTKNKKIPLSVVLLILAFNWGLSSAEMYRWVDKEGVIHLQDYPPREMKGVTRIETGRPEAPPGPATEKQQASAKNSPLDRSSINTVELFTTSWCPYCKQAKDYLTRAGIPFNEYDIEKDPDAQRRLNELAPGSGVPVAVVNGQVIKGFSNSGYGSLFR